jgi:hypothetical protein
MRPQLDPIRRCLDEWPAHRVVEALDESDIVPLTLAVVFTVNFVSLHTGPPVDIMEVLDRRWWSHARMDGVRRL